MAKHYTLCNCEGRPEPHWKFDEAEHWMIYLASRGVTTHDLLTKTMMTQLDPTASNTARFESVWLLIEILQSIWHMGGVMDDPEYVRHMLGEFEIRKWENFDLSWRGVRRLLEPHPAVEGALWYPPLEKVRAEECDVPEP